METMPSLVWAFYMFTVLETTDCSLSTNSCPYTLSVINSGPATVDVPVSITAELNCAHNDSHYYYVFEDDLQRSNITGFGSASTNFMYKDEGHRTVNVKAFLPQDVEVASCETTFEVINYIPGDLNFSGNLEEQNGMIYTKTNSIVNISVTLNYSPNVLEDSEFAFSWTIGTTWISTSDSFISHQFNSSGVQEVRVSVVGRIPTYDGTNNFHYKWGSFSSSIIVKDSFHSINISGNTYLEHGQLLNLGVSCNGSGPIEYCWKLLPTTSNQSNLSCSSLVSVPECKFPILYYFQDSGEFNIAIYINNIVTSMQRNIQVHIYDVSLRPQLSTVIIPVVCTILVVLIIAAALVVHMRRHTDFNVETADFDFMKTDENPTVSIETSWQIMRRSLWHMLRFRCFFYSNDAASANGNYGTMLVSRAP